MILCINTTHQLLHRYGKMNDGEKLIQIMVIFHKIVCIYVTLSR